MVLLPEIESEIFPYQRNVIPLNYKSIIINGAKSALK